MSIIIDLIMIALLIGVIMHSIHLSQSLKNFQALHKEMKPLLKEHVHSMSQGVKQADHLRLLIREVNQVIQTKTPEVHLLKQDLEFMTNRANQVADYLEKLLQEARTMGIANQYLNRKSEIETQTPSPKESGAVSQQSSPKPEKREKISSPNKATIVKRLRQKIAQPSSAGKANVSPSTPRNIEPFFKSTLTQKLAAKIREKNNAA